MFILLPFLGFYGGIRFANQYFSLAMLNAPLQTQVATTSSATTNKTVDQQAAEAAVTNFYIALTNQTGDQLFAEMTPPATATEKSAYAWLTGIDLGKDQFYRVFLGIKISQPKILSIQATNELAYQFKISDQYQTNTNGGKQTGWSAPKVRKTILINVVNHNGNWLVDQYTDLANGSHTGDAGIPKYSGFGQ